MTAGGAGERTPKADFLTLVMMFVSQASIHMGLVENPLSKKVTKDLRQARYAIDVLAMLEQKTKGNLDAEEARILGRALSEMRMKYVQASGSGGAS